MPERRRDKGQQTLDRMGVFVAFFICLAWWGKVAMIQQVRLIRMIKGVKAYEMAAILGYNPQYWLQVEKGLRQPPREIAINNFSSTSQNSVDISKNFLFWKVPQIQKFPSRKRPFAILFLKVITKSFSELKGSQNPERRQ